MENIKAIILSRLGVAAGLIACLCVIQVMGGQPSPLPHWLASVGFVAGLMTLAELYNKLRASGSFIQQSIGVIAPVTLVAGLYVFTSNTWAAWALLALFYALLACLDSGIMAASPRRRLGRWGARFILAAAGGFLPLLANQIESRFADEEFFVFLHGVELAGFCLLFLVAHGYLYHRKDRLTKHMSKKTHLASWLGMGSLVSLAVALILWSMPAYQGSFYTLNAPGYPGVTATSPFVCAQIAPDPAQPLGKEIHQRLLASVLANPNKAVLEFGMLALATGSPQWSQAFRAAILAEAEAGRFTGPANSVKSTQYEAAVRVYYTAQVHAAFPALFSEQEWQVLRAWFAAINRRALTVEWVDWMYALAFSKSPEGPYENQENGAGLLALLELEGLAPPELSSLNRAYLERNKRGWEQRFHNTDDAYVYQPEWVINAYFQSLYWRQFGQEPNLINRRLSFEWMLLQALPDGASLRYNHPGLLPMAGPAYLGALLTDDPRFIWWSARVLEQLGPSAFLRAWPGLEKSQSLTGESPTEGTCLIFSDSGLPNQKGPLAPDKIVFRDGWQPDSSYLLLNLRFSGWHRYKATNTISLFYNQEALVFERAEGQSYSWLPTGRSLFRDKRIPRENLNGLLIERRGLDSVLSALTGDSSWAQDPPHYAQVQTFETLGPLDITTTVLDDWQGWTHNRAIYFFHGGAVIVMDSAVGGQGQAHVTWHLDGEFEQKGDALTRSLESAKLILPAKAWKTSQLDRKDDSTLTLTYRAPRVGQLELATTLLVGQMGQAEGVSRALLDPQTGDYDGQYVNVQGNRLGVQWLYNATVSELGSDGLSTNGQMISLVKDVSTGEITVCYTGGTEAQVLLDRTPYTVMVEGDQRILEPGRDWTYTQGNLHLYNAPAGPNACVRVLIATK